MFQWLRRSRPDIDQKSTLAAPDAELFEVFTGIAAGGATISSAGALTVPAVAAAIRCISEAAATLYVTVERRDGKAWTEDDEHPAGIFLRGEVNPWTSGFELIRDLTAQALCSDAGGLAWVNRVEGRPIEIVHYRPGSLTVEFPDITMEPIYRLDGQVMRSADIIHLRGPFSRSPLSLARDAIGAAKEMERHAGGLFKNGARPGGVIEIAGSIGDAALKRLKAGWRQAHEGGENSGRTAVLHNGAKFNALTLKSTDAQFLELRRFQIEEIARAFRVPLGLLYEMTRQTWSNMEQATREFLIFSLEPWLRALEACFNRALIPAEDRAVVRIRFDRDDLTRASLTERATAINSLRASEVLSADEGRDWLDLPPRADGKGGSYDNPNITVKPATSPKVPA